MKKRQFKDWKIKEFFRENKGYIGNVFGLLVLLGIIATLSFYSVKWRIDAYKQFVIDKSKTIPGPFVLDVSNFEGIVTEESKLNITGVVIKQEEDPNYFKEGLRGSTSESILSYSHYKYTELHKNNRDLSSSQYREYILNLKLYNISTSCNRYERFDHKAIFYYHIGNHVYGLADEVIVRDEAIVVNVRQDVLIGGFWAKTISLSILMLVVIGLLIWWFMWSLGHFIKELKKAIESEKQPVC